MVLDEVESAAGIHNHDCITGSPRSAGGGGGGDDDSWSNELLRRGWDLTRKAAIAAAAATAAPPLIVLSAAGVALSVPFAAYLASLAATDHLMGALLRSCQPPSQPYSRGDDDDGLEQEFLDSSEGYGQDAPAFGHLDAEAPQGIVEEENVSDTSLPLSRDLGVSEATAPWFADDDVQGEFSAQESGRDSNSGDALLPVSRDPGVSEASTPAFAGNEVEKEEEIEAEISAQESCQDSYTSNRSDETEERTPMKTLPRSLGVPLFPEEDSVVQKKGGSEFSVLNSDQQLLQSNNWFDKEDGLYSKNNEEDDRTMEENKSANETVPQGFYFPESRVPATGDDDSVVQEKGEDEFSVQNSGQQQSFQFESRNFGEKEKEDGKTMEENKPSTVLQQTPAFAYFDTETEQAIIKEEEESDTSLLLSQDPGVSEASAPAFAVDEVEEEEVQGEFSAQTSGQDSYTLNRGDDAEYTPMEGSGSAQKDTLPGGFGVSASAKPLFPEERNVAQEKGNGEEAVQVSGQQSFQSNIWNKKEDDVYPKKEEGDGKSVEKNTSMEETVSQGFCFPRSRVPPSGEADDNVVQENEEGEFSAGILGQQSFQTKNGSDEKEEDDGKTMEENKSTEQMVPQGFYFPESRVPASGDDDNVVQRKGEDEFSVHNSGQQSFQFQSKNFGEKEEEDGKTMEENKPTTVSKEAPAFTYFDTETEQAIINEQKESDTSLLLSQDPGVSEALEPLFGVDQVEDVQGEFSAQASGQDSYTSNRGDDIEEYTQMEGMGSTQKVTLPGDFDVSASAKPLFPEDHNVAQEKGNGEEAVQVSGQQSFQSKISIEEEDDVYPKKEEGDGKSEEEKKSMKERVSQGFCFPQSLVPPSEEADDNVVQEKEEGEFSAGKSGQQSFQTKNVSDEKQEEDGKTTEKKKSTEEMPLQGFYESCVPASTDEDHVVQEKREGEFSVQNSDQLPLQSRIWNDKEEGGKTIEENKSTEPTHSQGSYFPKSSVPASGDEDNVVHEKAKGEFSVQNLGQYSLLSDIGDKKEHDITIEEKNSTEDSAPRDLVGSGSPAAVLHGEDNAVQSEEGFEVAAQGVLKEANSNADLVMDEAVDAQVEIIATAAPESEMLPPSTDLVLAEVVDVQVDIIATAAPDTEAPSPSNLVAREFLPDLVTGGVNGEYVAIVAAAEPESEVLHESNPAVCASTTYLGTGDGKPMEENKPTTVSQEAPVFAYFDTETEQAIIKEEKESDTSLLLSQDPGVSEAPAPAFAVVEVEEEVQGEFSDQTSGQDSYTTMEGRGSTQKETLPGAFGVSASAKPLFPEEHNVAQEKGNGEEAVQVSGQQSFQSNIWNEKEDDVYPKREEGDGKSVEENKSMEETVSQGLPPSGKANDYVVQEKEDGEFSAGILGQQPFQTKNGSDEKEEEDGKTTEENKSTEETLLQGFYESCVPASDDEGNVVQEKREGEFSVHNSDQLPVQSKIWNDKEEEGKTIEENKSTEPKHSQGSYFVKSSVPVSGDEDNVVNEKAKSEFSVQNLGQYSLLSDIGDKKEHDITMEEKKSTEELAPRDFIGSGSPAPVLHGDDNAVQRKEGFEVAAQWILEEANSNTDLVMAEVVDVQVEIIANVAPQSEVLPPTTNLVMAEVADAQVEIISTAAPESEVLPPGTDLVIAEVVDVQVEIIPTAAPDSEALSPSNLVTRELHPDLVTGEVNDVYVASVASAEPEGNLLHESKLVVCASTEDLGTGEMSDVQVNVVAAAKPEDEALQLSNLASCESQAVVETANIGEIIGIAAMEDIVRNVGDVNKEDMECCLVPVVSMHDTEDVISSGSTPYFSTMGDEIIDLPDQSSDVGYTVMNEAIGGRVVAHGEAHYTEEQLREQLDTLKTITGYDAVPSSTLEGELAGLYIFVGVEPPVGSSDSSDRLMELSAKLWFLKSIIGVD